MNATLHFVDHLLVLGRNLQRSEQHDRALDLFHKIQRLRTLSADELVQTHRHLGELQMEAEHYAQARRHFAVCVRHEPSDAGLHYAMGQCHIEDRDGDPRRACEHFREALELDPENASYACALGLALCQVGQKEEGLATLERALRLAADSYEIVEKCVNGLIDLELVADARTLLEPLRFRLVRERRVRELWDLVRFHETRENQTAKRTHLRLPSNRPTLLPFVRKESKPRRQRIAGKTIRIDSAEGHVGPTKVPGRLRRTVE